MYKIFLQIVFIFFSTVTFAQYNGNTFSISSSLVYTTTAEIYLNPNSFDPIIRNRSFQLIDVMSTSIDLRYRISEPLIIGLCAEYMEVQQDGRNLTVLEGNNEIRLKTRDGFVLIPVETSVYYLMPFSTVDFKFLMGAGLGIYFGEFSREFGDTRISTIQSEVAFGMHVSIAMEYILIEQLGFKLEMKFRDPEFKNTSKYDSNIVNYEGSQIIIMRDTFDTKVNVNGISFLLGAAFYF